MQTFKTEQEAREYSTSNPSETVELKLYWSNGHMHCFYVGGNMHGEYKLYHNNGQLLDHYFYVNSKANGEFKSYYSDGQLMYHCFYVNGLEHGEYKSHYNCGQLIEHLFYAGGKEIKFDHLLDGSYKSLCILSTLFDGNIIDADI